EGDGLECRQTRGVLFAFFGGAIGELIGSGLELLRETYDVAFDLLGARADTCGLGLDAANLFTRSRGSSFEFLELRRQLRFDRLRHLAGGRRIAERLSGPGVRLRPHLRDLLRQSAGCRLL